MDKILEVKKLKIAFRTSSGTLKAVRDISFDLERGKTLAIVGESGSGKSVTSKAIIGILAGNSIIEGGEILYDGKDLLRIPEDEMHRIRGDKISMIFQDPLSSLNPIVKIGKQITEAMLLKNKANRREARTELKRMLKLVREKLNASGKSDADAVFDRFCKSGYQEDPAFVTALAEALRMNADSIRPARQQVVEEMSKAHDYYSSEFTEKEGMAYAQKLISLVSSSIDRTAIVKDSAAYAFGTSMTNAVTSFFTTQIHNKKEERRFASQTRKHDALVARGKTVEWKVVPKNVYSVEELRENILTVVDRVKERTAEALQREDDYEAHARQIVAYLQKKKAETTYHITKEMAREKAIQLMEEVGIHEPEKRYNQYPFEFSGGMRQRIVIAIALAADPDILICDEPTTALDVTIQAQILELINRLKAERNLSVVFITHDLGVVANMADDIAVMYAGKIVEYGTAEEVFYDPRHPYTWALLSSMPDLDTTEKLDAIPGTPPNMIYPPVGDAFADRNKYAMQIDFEQQPPMFKVSDTHYAATWLLHPDAPKVEIPRIIRERIARSLKDEGGVYHG